MVQEINLIEERLSKQLSDGIEDAIREDIRKAVDKHSKDLKNYQHLKNDLLITASNFMKKPETQKFIHTRAVFDFMKRLEEIDEELEWVSSMIENP